MEIEMEINTEIGTKTMTTASKGKHLWDTVCHHILLQVCCRTTTIIITVLQVQVVQVLEAVTMTNPEANGFGKNEWHPGIGLDDRPEEQNQI